MYFLPFLRFGRAPHFFDHNQRMHRFVGVEKRLTLLCVVALGSAFESPRDDSRQVYRANAPQLLCGRVNRALFRICSPTRQNGVDSFHPRF